MFTEIIGYILIEYAQVLAKVDCFCFHFHLTLRGSALIAQKFPFLVADASFVQRLDEANAARTPTRRQMTMMTMMMSKAEEQ